MSDIRIQQTIRIAETKSKPVDVKKEDSKPEVQAQAPAVNLKSADEVLSFLSNSSTIAPNTDIKAKSKKIEVSKYVTPEQASRIGESVSLFFAGMEKHVEQAMKEFNLNTTQAQNLTALHFNQKFEDEDAAIIASGERFLVK